MVITTDQSSPGLAAVPTFINLCRVIIFVSLQKSEVGPAHKISNEDRKCKKSFQFCIIIVQPNIYLIVSVFAVLISNKKYIISIYFMLSLVFGTYARTKPRF